jgi:hypothetical protein
MPNFAYAVASVPVAASGQVVAPTLSAPGVVIPFTASSQALQNVRSGTQAAAFRKQIGDTVAPVLDVSADAFLPGYIGPGGLWTSPLLPSAGMVHCSLSLLSSQGGAATLNKYADALGALLVSSTTATVTANAASTVGDAATTLFTTFSLAISNTAAAGATISSAVVLMGSK